MEYVLAGVCLVVLVAVVIFAAEKGRKDALERELRSVAGLNAQHVLIGVDGHSGVAIDGDSAQVCLMWGRAGAYERRLLRFVDIISSSVEEDGDVISSASRGGQLMRAAVGGVVLGGVGAVVGAVTANRTQKRRINQVTLKLVVDDLAKPVHELVLQNTPSDSEGLVHSSALRQANEWQGRFEAVIRQGARDAVGS